MSARFYAPFPDVPGFYQLPKLVSHHAFRVCRIRKHETLILFDGCDREAHAICIDPIQGIVDIHCIEPISRESTLHTLLIQALPAMDRMEFVIQKAVELGVTQIQPVESTRSVVRLKGERAEKKQAHWERLIIAACEQSGRTRIPQLFPVRSLDDALRHHASQTALKWLLSPHANLTPLTSHTSVTAVQLLVGPEGGFSEEENQLAVNHGFSPMQLGPRVLRTETAGLTALSICQWQFGDFIDRLSYSHYDHDNCRLLK